MAGNTEYSWPSASVDSQPCLKNSVSHPGLVQSADMKPTDMEARLSVLCVQLVRIRDSQYTASRTVLGT